MSNIEKFLVKIPGSISTPNDVDASITEAGDLLELTGVDVIVRSLTRLFLLPSNTYIFDPPLGTGLYKYVFEPVDTITKASIEQEIQFNIARYETRAEIKFKVLFFKNKKGFRINLNVGYEGKNKTVNVDIDESLIRTLGAT